MAVKRKEVEVTGGRRMWGIACCVFALLVVGCAVQHVEAPAPLPEERVPHEEAEPYTEGEDGDGSPGIGEIAGAVVGAMAAPPRFHVWDLLTDLDTEMSSYGMYTYVLFGRRVDESEMLQANRDRYLALLIAIRSSVVLTPGEATSIPAETNLFYIPVDDSAHVDMSSEDLLRHYHSVLAIQIINNISQLLEDIGEQRLAQRIRSRPGPFLVSTLQPIGEATQRGDMICADLSTLHPDVMREVVTAYKQRVETEAVEGVEIFRDRRVSLANIGLRTNDLLWCFCSTAGRLIPLFTP